MNGTGRFEPGIESLRRSLAWHANVTTELQHRLVEAQKYVRTHSGDPKLMAILAGNNSVANAFEGIDTAAAFRLEEP